MMEQHKAVVDQQMTNTLSIQAQHIKTELAHFVDDNSAFKVDVDQQLQAHQNCSRQNIFTKHSCSTTR